MREIKKGEGDMDGERGKNGRKRERMQNRDRIRSEKGKK